MVKVRITVRIEFLSPSVNHQTVDTIHPIHLIQSTFSANASSRNESGMDIVDQYEEDSYLPNIDNDVSTFHHDIIICPEPYFMHNRAGYPTF